MQLLLYLCQPMQQTQIWYAYLCKPHTSEKDVCDCQSMEIYDQMRKTVLSSTTRHVAVAASPHLKPSEWMHSSDIKRVNEPACNLYKYKTLLHYSYIQFAYQMGSHPLLGCHHWKLQKPLRRFPDITHRWTPLNSYYTIRKHRNVLGHIITWGGKPEKPCMTFEGSCTEKRWPP